MDNKYTERLVRQIIDEKNIDAIDTLQTILLKKCAERIESVQKE